MPNSENYTFHLDAEVGVDHEVAREFWAAVSAHVLYLYGRDGLARFRAVGPGTLMERLFFALMPEFGIRCMNQVNSVGDTELTPMNSVDFGNVVKNLKNGKADAWIDTILGMLGWQKFTGTTSARTSASDADKCGSEFPAVEEEQNSSDSDTLPNSDYPKRSSWRRDWPTRAKINISRSDDKGWNQLAEGGSEETVSLDQYVHVDGESRRLVECCYDESSFEGVEAIGAMGTADRILDEILLKKLTPIEERAVRLRFGLVEEGEDGPYLTYNEVGRAFNRSQWTVGKIIRQALRKLRKSPDFRSFAGDRHQFR